MNRWIPTVRNGFPCDPTSREAVGLPQSLVDEESPEATFSADEVAHQLKMMRAMDEALTKMLSGTTDEHRGPR